MEIRYHLDENVNNAVARGLRRRGIEVTVSKDAELIGAEDPSQLAFAASQGCILVTHDSDHLRLAAAGASHAGIAFRHSQGCSVGDLVHPLVDLWRVRTAEEMNGKVVFLTRNKR